MAGGNPAPAQEKVRVPHRSVHSKVCCEIMKDSEENFKSGYCMLSSAQQAFTKFNFWSAVALSNGRNTAGATAPVAVSQFSEYGGVG